MNTKPKTVTADMQQYRRNYAAKRKAAGLCIYCGLALPKERRELRRVACVPCTRDRS
ncbi:MAG: hypothetical protein ACOYOF_15335 [Verrucomicrobiaceae bacterium]